MDSELVSDSDYPNKVGKGDKQNNSLSPFLAYTTVFKKHFPYYLSVGMSYDEYWNGDAELVKDYRLADEYRRERRNQELWMQGLYVYTAIANLSPILHDFVKRGTTAEPYPDKPFPITPKEVREEKERKERERYMRLMSYMQKKKQGESEVVENVD